MNNGKKGFITLALVIGVSSILLAFMYARSIDVFYFFDLATRKEYRLMNYYNAYNCIDRVVLNLAHDYFYEVSTSVSVPELNCTIDKVERKGDEIFFEATGVFRNIRVKRKGLAEISKNEVRLVWVE